jgi:hypothetical protein
LRKAESILTSSLTSFLSSNARELYMLKTYIEILKRI